MHQELEQKSQSNDKFILFRIIWIIRNRLKWVTTIEIIKKLNVRFIGNTKIRKSEFNWLKKSFIIRK